jgi:subtilisin family serine protease
LPAPQRTSFEAGQVVVYWASSDEADAALAALAQGSRMVPLQSGRLDNLGGVLAVFQLPAQADALAFRDRLLREFPGLAVDLNAHYRPLSQPSPRIYLPQKIDVPGLGNKAGDAAGVRIGVVDGPAAAIPALLLVRMARKSFLDGADIAATPAHATAIAALMAGRDTTTGFTGIATGAGLYSAEVMRAAGPDTLATSAALVRAVDWLLGEKVQIINLSLGGPGDAVMARVFARLAGMAVVVVAAAGNGGPAAAPSYPAAYAGVIAVTATDAADRPYSAANRGAYIALAAPGVDLWVPDDASGHYVSGTSFAAAVVTAGSAWLLAQNPRLDAPALVRRLCRNARDLGAPGPDPVFGCGLMQIAASLREERP